MLFVRNVIPVDITKVRPGHEATTCFDPFDYTIFGGVKGEVGYVSADSLKESTSQGEEIYYRVHVTTNTNLS